MKKEAVLPNVAPRFIDKREFAKMLGVSTKTLEARRARGELPLPLDLGPHTRRVQWRLADVEQWIADLPTR